MSTTQDKEADNKAERTSLGEYWRKQLDHAETVFQVWETRAAKVVDRYRDSRSKSQEGDSKFNILWSNIGVLKPSLYGRQAKPEVSRRYMDADPVGRLASTILERALEYEIVQFPDFHRSMDCCVEDRLLPGRGVAWLRFEPLITEAEVSTAPVEGVQVTSTEEPVTTEAVESAHSPVEYVYWKDFLHSPARTWDEVWWVARWVYMTKDEGIERFGDVFNDVPLNEYKEDNSDKSKDSSAKSEYTKKAKVAEIWDKRTGRVCWIAKGYFLALDEKEDPLHLEGFFPCPMPLYATTTNGSLVPVPDYTEYQDQADELDKLTGRITNMVRAVKAVGVYDSSNAELKRMLDEGQDNKLFGVSNWAGLAEKGGLKGAIEMLDLTNQIQAIAVLQAQRESVKQVIYEISGISDVMRGSTKAEETLGAQQLKTNFGSLRLRTSQTDVARFASDIFRLKAQIICSFYPPDLIIKMSGVAETEDGRNQELLQAAIQMLKTVSLRDFHIAVESDILAQIDDQSEKEAASEAIGAIGNFLKEAIPMVGSAPETLPMVSEMLLFLVRRYRAGRGLEAAIENAMKALQQKAAQAAANPQPTEKQQELAAQAQTEQMRLQAQAQAEQQKAQADQQVQASKLQQEGMLEERKSQFEQARIEHEAQIKREELQSTDALERWKAELEATTKIQIESMRDATQLELARVAAENPTGGGTGPDGEAAPTPEPIDVGARFDQLENMFWQFAQQPPTPEVSQAPAAPAVQHFSLNLADDTPKAPRITKQSVVRGADNRASHVKLTYDDGTEKHLPIERDGTGRIAGLTHA